MHFEHIDLGGFVVMFNSIALVVSIEMLFRESVSIITLIDYSPNDGARTCS